MIRPAGSDLPNWPSLMDVQAAAAYLAISEGSFRRLAARTGVQPVELGMAVMRWRRTDLDRLVEQLPPRETRQDGLTHDETDPGTAALDRVRHRSRKST